MDKDELRTKKTNLDNQLSSAKDTNKTLNSNSSAGGELYSQNRENKKSFGAIYPPKDFF